MENQESNHVAELQGKVQIHSLTALLAEAMQVKCIPESCYLAA